MYPEILTLIDLVEILTYILKSISDGKNENQIAERFDGNTSL
ncbi:MAG: hypothetical protein ACM3X1_09385 [Ignavibacteriales bacterium]